MDEKLKIYEPNEIEDTPIEQVESETGNTDSTSDTTGVTNPPSIPSYVPKTVLASDIVNESLDTQMRKIKSDYGFTETGSIQIGKYVALVSGQILISPDGIVAISKDDGLPSITIDGQTGNATFKGTIAAGSIVVGYVADVGGEYTTTSTAAAAKVQIFPDANTGIIAYASNGTSVVFKVEVGGTNVGDVTIGNYAGNEGMLWDQSAGTFYIRGTMSAGDINASNVSITNIDADNITSGTLSGRSVTIGSGNAIFKATSSGIQLGHATFGSAPFRVDMDGNVTATSVTISGVLAGSGQLKTSTGNSRLEFTDGDKLTFYNGGSIKGQLRGGSNSGIIADIGSFVTKVDEGFYACVNTSYSDFFKFFCTDVSGTVSGVIEAPNSNKVYLTDASGNTLTSWSTTQFYSAKKILLDDGLQFNTTGNSTTNGRLWYYDAGGGNYYWRSRNGSWNGQFDQTGF